MSHAHLLYIVTSACDRVLAISEATSQSETPETVGPTGKSGPKTQDPFRVG